MTEVFPEHFGATKIEVSCVRPERTFLEKAALIHEQNTRPLERSLALGQARHLYDLVRLWAVGGVAESSELSVLFESVRSHREVYYNYSWVDYQNLNLSSLWLTPPEERIAHWKQDYEMMESMFYSKPIPFPKIVSSLCEIKSSLAGKR